MKMAVMHWTLLFVLLTAGAVFSTSPILNTSGEIHEMNIGNWSVGDCILAKFAMNFTVSPNEILRLIEESFFLHCSPDNYIIFVY